ncbi:MAG: c-type cytochrome [Dissulfurimicrobium sp.]|uniref:c-type cytochrome n=1 Tax=Dissulfurimicrobium sp. TaxID=2022436 RepID=UPI003D10C358
MDRLSDLLLVAPISQTLLRGLLFASFTLHMLFVLLTLGTAILAIYYFIDSQCGGRAKELRFDKRILKTFMAHKSLAVVLGVAPLLLIQVGYTVPFFTAVNLFAPYWMSVIVFLIVAFLAFDALGHRIYLHRYIHLALGTVALIFLLAVPGLFSAILTAFENPDKWPQITSDSYRLTGALAIRWLFRYLHVLGAGVVFGAGFHYFFTAEDETERKALQRWLVAGILLQFILGIMLYGVFPSNPGHPVIIYLFTGIAAASFLLWLVFFAAERGLLLNIKIILPVLMLVLVSMLLTRQFLQDRALIPLQKRLEANAVAYGNALRPFEQQALAGYGAVLKVVYDNGKTIYARSCAFCHGENGDGKGVEAKGLAIPPEDISAIRTTRGYLYGILKDGVHGSAMPYFTFFDRDKLDSLMDYMDKRWKVLDPPEAVLANVSKQAMAQAQGAYAKTCAGCHGMDGKGAKSSKNLEPQPPDLTAYSLSPKRTFDIISNGYPGTMMPAFGDIPEEVRWGLVEIVNKKRGFQ